MFRARDVVRDGLLTPDALRSSAWRRLFRGIYADADLPHSFGIRIRGARLLAPPSALFSGRSAAYLLGAPSLVDADPPVEVCTPPDARFGPVHGLRIRKVSIPAEQVRVRYGFRCTDGVRTALDIARAEALLDAVPALDVLTARGVVSRQALARAGTAVAGGRGARSARLAISLADPRAESPPESRVRVLLALAGLPATPQYEVRDRSGRFLARVDLAYPELRLAIEYDGAWHGEPGQFARDRRRLNGLVAAGWLVLHVTAADLHRPDELVARVRALRATREGGVPGL